MSQTAVTQYHLPRNFPPGPVWVNEFMGKNSLLTFSEVGTLSCVCRYFYLLSKDPRVATTALLIWKAFLKDYQAQQTIPINSFAEQTRHIFTNRNQLGILVSTRKKIDEQYNGRQLLPPDREATGFVLVGRTGDSSSIPFQNNVFLGIAFRNIFVAPKEDNHSSVIAIDINTRSPRPESSKFSSYFRSIGNKSDIIHVGKVHQKKVENVAQQIFTVSRNGAIVYWDAETFEHLSNKPFALDPNYTKQYVREVHQLGNILYMFVYAEKVGEEEDLEKSRCFFGFYDVGQNCNELELIGILPGTGLYPPKTGSPAFAVDSNKKIFVFYPTQPYVNKEQWMTAYAREGSKVSLKWRIGPFKYIDDIKIGEKWIVVTELGAVKAIHFFYADSGKLFYSEENQIGWKPQKLLEDDILLYQRPDDTTTLHSLHIPTRLKLPAIPTNGELQHVHVESTGGERTLEMVVQLANKQLQLTRYRNTEVVFKEMSDIDEPSKSCCERFWQWIKFVFTELMLHICTCVQRVLCLKTVPCFPAPEEN